MALYYKTELSDLITVKRTLKKHIIWAGFRGLAGQHKTGDDRTWFGFVYSQAGNTREQHSEYYKKLTADMKNWRALDKKLSLRSHFCLMGDWNVRLGGLTNDYNAKGKPGLSKQGPAHVGKRRGLLE